MSDHPHGPALTTSTRKDLDMTTHQGGQHRPVSGILSAHTDATVGLLRESRMVVVAQAHQVLTMAQYRAQAMSLNKQPGSPVQSTDKRAYWRDLGRTLYWRLRDTETDMLRRPEATLTNPARVVVHYGFQDRATGARDGVNLSPMTKALVDGLADAGLAEDDSSLLIPGQDSRLLPERTPKGQVWVVLTVMGGRPLRV